jgi:hypothetical protein
MLRTDLDSTMERQRASSSLPPFLPPQTPHVFAGRVEAQSELPINTMFGDTFMVDGSEDVRAIAPNPAGPPITLIFPDSPTLYNSSKLMLSNGLDRQMAPNEVMQFVSIGDGIWREVNYRVFGASELAYWRRMYKLLSPEAYTFVGGSDPTWVVPEGKTWYALNMWFTWINSNGPYFHRKLDIANALELTAGTTITSSPSHPYCYMYYCDPSLVDDPVGDPREAYFARIARLSTLALSSIGISIPSGSAAETLVSTNFPEDFTNGFVRGVSSHDISWLGMARPDAAVNTLDEISDTHQLRFTGAIMVPFARSVFGGIKACGGSVSGSASEPTLGGYGTLLYQKLPADW